MSRSRSLRVAMRAAAVFAAALVVLLALVKIVFGRGDPYRDVSTAPRLPASAAEPLYEHEWPLGNVTSSADGRIFFNTHPFVVSQRFTDAFVFELAGGAARPYPDRSSQPDLQHTFGMTVDRQNRLWLISPATLERERTRLVAIDLATNERVVDHWFEPGVARFSQDLRIAPDGRTAYLADTGAFHFTSASIIVVDLETFETRTRLDTNPSAQPQDWIIQTAHGPHRIGYGLLTFAVGVDGVALSPDGEWLYYATMTHDSLYRVRTSDLRDGSVSEATLSGRIERIADKPLSDGIEIASNGEVLITDVEHGALVAVDPATGALETLVRRDDVVWADGVNVMAEGSVLFSDSAIPSYLDPLLRPPAEDVLRAGGPYRLYRVRAQ